MENQKGNVHVCVRVRPPVDGLVGRSRVPVLQCNSHREILIKERQSEKQTRSFVFDHVFPPESSQEDLSTNVMSPFIEDVMNGYSCTIFAYGHTGTGKTYTIEGEKSQFNTPWDLDPKGGLIPRSIGMIFNRLESLETDYTVIISFLEIYNEELIDLMSNEESKLKLYEDPSKKAGIVVSGLKKVIVPNKTIALEMIESACAKRQSSSTSLNSRSSRSHAIFTVKVHMKDPSDVGERFIRYGKLTLVDLAGNECVENSGANDKQAREAGKINQSILTLNRVILSLYDRNTHVPYRESKLTRLLQDSLGGSTKTMIMATVAPQYAQLEETLNTLDYMNKAKHIVNKPQPNKQILQEDVLKKYAETMEKLRKDLVANRDKEGFYIAEENYEGLMNQVDLLEEDKRKLKEEVQRTVKLVDEFKSKVAELTGKNEELVATVQENNVAVSNLKTAATNIAIQLEGKILKYDEIEKTNEGKVHASQSAQREFIDKLKSQFDVIVDALVDQITKLLQDFEKLTDNRQREMNKMFVDTCKSFVNHRKQTADILQTHIEKHLDALFTMFSNMNDQSKSQVECSAEMTSEFNRHRTEMLSGIKSLVVNHRSDVSGAIADMKVLVDNCADENSRLKECVANKNECFENTLAGLNSDHNRFQEEIISEYENKIQELKGVNKQLTDNSEQLKKSLLETSNNYEQLKLIVNRQSDISKCRCKETNRMKTVSDKLIKAMKKKQNELELQLSCTRSEHDDYKKEVAKMIDNYECVLEEVKHKTDVEFQECLKKVTADCESVMKKRIDTVLSTHAATLAADISRMESEVTRVRTESEQIKEILDIKDKHRNLFVNRLNNQIVECVDKVDRRTKATLTCIENITKEVNSGFQEYVPSGDTPQRENYCYQSQLKGCSPHERIRLRFRRETGQIVDEVEQDENVIENNSNN